MINFTVGPVQSTEEIRLLGKEQVPYFRTEEFSRVMLENERLMKSFAKAPEGSRAVFLTGSGTASMEAAVINTLTEKDRVLIIDGGSFGHRFVEMLQIHRIPHHVLPMEMGKDITAEALAPFENAGFTAFVVNIHETSTGVRYNLPLIRDFCKRNHLFLLVDAISSFLADPIDMKDDGIDVLLTGSQKALACPPGVSIMVLSPKALDRIAESKTKCMYFDLKSALKNGERGQTPFTPAVGILLQLHARLCQIERDGGVERETEKIAMLAADFRKKIAPFPFEIVSESLSNAVTPLHPVTGSAYDIFLILKDEYHIWVCPNGGSMRDLVFRVGHIGDLSTKDNDMLIAALCDLQKRGII